jgi:hypothetical protein
MARYGRRSRNNRMRGGLRCASMTNPNGPCHDVHGKTSCDGVWRECTSEGNSGAANAPANTNNKAPAHENLNTNNHENLGSNNNLTGGRRRRSRRMRGAGTCVGDGPAGVCSRKDLQVPCEQSKYTVPNEGEKECVWQAGGRRRSRRTMRGSGTCVGDGPAGVCSRKDLQVPCEQSKYTVPNEGEKECVWQAGGRRRSRRTMRGSGTCVGDADSQDVCSSKDLKIPCEGTQYHVPNEADPRDCVWQAGGRRRRSRQQRRKGRKSRQTKRR